MGAGGTPEHLFRVSGLESESSLQHTPMGMSCGLFSGAAAPFRDRGDCRLEMLRWEI